MSAVGRSVQFRGIDNVIQAYESNDVAPWALFQGAQLLAKAEGNDLESNKVLLSSLLNKLNNDDNIATYTLCVYDDLKSGEKIKNNTKYDGSFNFKLNDTMNDYKSQNRNGIGALMEKIDAMEARWLAKSNETVEDEPEEEKSMWGQLGKIIDHPDVQRAIAGKFVAILDGITNIFPGKVPAFVSPSFPAQIGAVTTALSAEQSKKVSQSIEYLSQVDPNLGDHLLAIAMVAQNEPAKYSQLIGMIKLL